MSDSSANAPKHVLIIVRNNVNRDARVLKEARSLTEAGYRVTVMGLRTSAEDKPLELREYCTLRRVTTTALSEDASSVSEASVSGRKTSSSPYTGPIGELRHWAGRMRENRIYHAAALPLRPDVVISCDLTALPAGAWLKRDLGCRLVYDAHELFTEMSGAGGVVYRLLYGRTESYLIRRCDAVITVNELIAEELSRRYRVPVPGVVMNGPSERVDAPTSVHQPVKVLYQGGYVAGRGLETVVREAARLRGAATLTMQGFGVLEAELRRIVDEDDLGDVVEFAEPCAPEDVVSAAHGHDVGLAIYMPISLNNRLSSPNKLFDYMAAGVAVVASDLAVARKVLQESRAGVLFDATEPMRAIESAVELARDETTLMQHKRFALSGVEPYLWESQAKTLLDAVDDSSR